MGTQATCFGRTLVIAPHPDDETIGAGGTIAKIARAGCDVFVAIVTTGQQPEYSAEHVGKVRSETEKAHRLLGVKETFWLDLPAARLSETPVRTLNESVRSIMLQIAPDTVLMPFVGDIHVDHQLVFQAVLVASRPHQADYPKRLLAYETLSETNWNAPYLTPGFIPNVFVEITDTLETKLEAMSAFGSQVKSAPHERSIEALRALATLRGATVHRPAAEGFVLIREVINA